MYSAHNEEHAMNSTAPHGDGDDARVILRNFFHVIGDWLDSTVVYTGGVQL